MALWGNKDSKTASGTVSIASTGVVTGSGTSFTTQAKIGNYIRANGVDYEIVKITSNTAATVRAGTNGAAIAVVSGGTSYTLSEKPAFVAASEASNVSGWAGAGKAEAVFGVNATEVHAGGDNITDVSVIQGGSGYVEAPGVTIAASGGAYSASATASISGGKVTTNLNCFYLKLNISYAGVNIVASDFLNQTVTNTNGDVVAKSPSVSCFKLNTPLLELTFAFNSSSDLSFSGNRNATTAISL